MSIGLYVWVEATRIQKVVGAKLSENYNSSRLNCFHLRQMISQCILRTGTFEEYHGDSRSNGATVNMEGEQLDVCNVSGRIISMNTHPGSNPTWHYGSIATWTKNIQQHT